MNYLYGIEVNKEQKALVVEKYSQLLESYSSIFLLENLGVNVFDSKAIRGKFKSLDVKFLMVKNTLAKRAVKGTKFENIADHFSGPVMMACANEPIQASKSIVEFLDKDAKFRIICGSVEGREVYADEVLALSKLPGILEIRAGLVALLQSPASKILSLAKEPGARLARLLSMR